MRHATPYNIPILRIHLTVTASKITWTTAQASPTVTKKTPTVMVAVTRATQMPMAMGSSIPTTTVLLFPTEARLILMEMALVMTVKATTITMVFLMALTTAQRTPRSSLQSSSKFQNFCSVCLGETVVLVLVFYAHGFL